MLRHGINAGFVALVLSISACDSGNQNQQATVPAGPAPPAITFDQGRDLETLDVCVLMPDEVVAQILGVEITQPGRRQDYGKGAQGCEYSLGRAERGAGAGPFEYVFIYVNTPASFGTLQEALATDQRLGQKVSGTAVSGLGDQAFAIDNQTEHSTSLRVLVKNDVALDIKANNLDHARKLAETALQKLEAM